MLYHRLNIKQPVVLFLHAFPLHHKMWKPQMDLLQDLDIPFLAIDYPGLGRSLKPTQKYSMIDLAREIMSVMEVHQIEKFIPLGCSMGGYVALQLFHLYPDKIAGMVLSNTRASADSKEGREKRFQLIHDIEKTRDLEPIKTLHLKKFFSEKSRKEKPETISFVKNMMDEITPEGVTSALYAMAYREDFTELLNQMNIPVLIIHGEEDAFIPLKDSQLMHTKIKNSLLEILQHSGHLSNLEVPERYNTLLKKFLSQFY